jgi:Tfp pilus assembly protein PilF
VNDSDLGVALLHLRCAALFAQGHLDAAFESFKQALAKTAGRDAELLKVVRYDRALAYETAGQKAKAKADLERIYAIDPGYEDIRDRLASLA